MIIVQAYGSTKKYLGTLLKSGKIAIFSAYNEIYFGITDKKTVKLIHSESEELTSNYLLEKIKEVDGAGSGLDADLFNNHSLSYFQTAISASVGIEIGKDRVGDRQSYIDFHASDDASELNYSARILRDSGVNGIMYFYNNAEFNFNNTLKTIGTWDKPIILNSNSYLWDDGTNLYGKVGTAPTSATDGTIII